MVIIHCGGNSNTKSFYDKNRTSLVQEDHQNKLLSAKVLTEEKYNELKSAFEKCDRDGSNCIDASELKDVLISLGKNPTDEEVESMIASVDDNGNGTIEFEEFIHLMEDEERSFKTEDLMRQAFSVLDPEGMGYLTTERLKQVVTNLGLDMTDDEIAEMMEEADPGGSGKVEYGGIIGLISTENETLATAFQKREKIEAIKRDEIARDTAREEEESVQQEGLERRTDIEESEREMEHIPDMDEIASQYDNEQYDQFSRQIPVGGRVVKRPGRRLPMSTTRMKYLQRKNKSLSQDTSLQGSMMSLNEANEQDTSKYLHQTEFKTHFRIIHDDLMNINERTSVEPRSRSNQQRQYKHVESRLLDPKYYLKKATNTDEPNPNTFALARVNSVRVDFGKVQKDFKNNKPEVLKGLVTRSISTSNIPSHSPVQTQQQTYTERARREKQLTNEHKFYYAVWRSAFSQAIERLRESKIIKAIQLNTPDLLKEKAIAEEKARKYLKNKPRQKPRLAVISPTLQTNAQVSSIIPHSRFTMGRGSYTERFKKRHNIEETFQEDKWETKPFLTPRKHRLDPLQKGGEVITKSALNRRTMRLIE